MKMLRLEPPSNSNRPHLSSVSSGRRNSQKSLRLVTPKSVSVTFSAIEIDGRHLQHDAEDMSISRLAEAIRLAQVHGKEFVMVTNIAPGAVCGEESAKQVPLIMAKIQKMVQIACRDSMQGESECRLDLQHGQFSLRCYLGRTKPTDFTFAEDRLSDSR